MRVFNLGTILCVAAIGLLGWGLFEYLDRQPLNHENCGVTVAPKAGQTSIPVSPASKVCLQLINRSGRPIRIVGNNAC